MEAAMDNKNLQLQSKDYLLDAVSAICRTNDRGANIVGYQIKLFTNSGETSILTGGKTNEKG